MHVICCGADGDIRLLFDGNTSRLATHQSRRHALVKILGRPDIQEQE